MFVFIKKPSNLDFKKEEYSDEQVKKLTVCTRNGLSNTKLVVYEDGSVYLKNGSQFLRLSNKEIKKPTYVCKNKETGLCIVEKLKEKSFLHKE